MEKHLIGIGLAAGENERAIEAAKQAVSSPLIGIVGATDAIINVTELVNQKCNNRNNIADEYRLCGSKYNINNKWNNKYIRK